MPMHQGFLPREGLYSVTFLKLFTRTALNPSLVLPLLLLARYTKRGRDLTILHPTAYGRIKKLFYWGLLRVVVKYLSDRTRNNWVKDRYDWSREIVLITGGAAGIGGQMVKLFDELAVKVVVLDVQPMAFATCKFSYFITRYELVRIFLTEFSVAGAPLQVRPAFACGCARGRRQSAQGSWPPYSRH